MSEQEAISRRQRHLPCVEQLDVGRTRLIVNSSERGAEDVSQVLTAAKTSRHAGGQARCHLHEEMCVDGSDILDDRVHEVERDELPVGGKLNGNQVRGSTKKADCTIRMHFSIQATMPFANGGASMLSDASMVRRLITPLSGRCMPTSSLS